MIRDYEYGRRWSELREYAEFHTRPGRHRRRSPAMRWHALPCIALSCTAWDAVHCFAVMPWDAVHCGVMRVDAVQLEGQEEALLSYIEVNRFVVSRTLRTAAGSIHKRAGLHHRTRERRMLRTTSCIARCMSSAACCAHSADCAWSILHFIFTFLMVYDKQPSTRSQAVSTKPNRIAPNPSQSRTRTTATVLRLSCPEPSRTALYSTEVERAMLHNSVLQVRWGALDYRKV